MSYTLTQAKDLVINQGYAIKNDDSAEKLREVLKFCFPEDSFRVYKNYKYYFRDEDCNSFICWLMDDNFDGNSINLSEIEIPKQITIEMVIELTKKYTNDMELGSELRKLLNN